MFERFLALLNRIPVDKVRHFNGGCAISSMGLVVGLLFVRFYKFSPKVSIIVALSLSFVLTGLAAALKEAYDAHHTDIHSPETMDLWATILGGIPVWTGFFVGVAL